MNAERIEPRWTGLVVVAASGPSLTPEVAAQCRDQTVVAVNDAYRLLPWADVLYACDPNWWRAHDGCKDFGGERWTSFHEGRRSIVAAVAKPYKLHTVHGEKKETFSLDPARIHYGRNSGFQAINLALLWGGNPIVLVGFNFCVVDKRPHFFGKHPKGLVNGSNYVEWVKTMQKAADALPPHLSIINCTPDSAIKCFPTGDLREVLHGLVLVTPPDSLPVTLTEVKEQLNIQHDDEDDLLMRLIEAATESLDGPYGDLCGRALKPQTWDFFLDAFPGSLTYSFPNGPTDGIRLPLPPLIEVLSVNYVDPDSETEVELAISGYAIDSAGSNIHGWVVPSTGGWPTPMETIDAVRVRYTAGYPDEGPVGTTVPARLRQAIIMLVLDMYGRGSAFVDRTQTPTTDAIRYLTQHYVIRII